MLTKSWEELKILHSQGAEKVYFEPCVNKDGSSLFASDRVFTDKNKMTNSCYEVRVHVVIDDTEFDVQSPLMNGSNPVKDNSLTQQRVWNAQTRAFVKGVAVRTGLGFNLWLGEESTASKYEDDLYAHDIFKIKERVQEYFTYLLKRGYSKADVAKTLNLSEKKLSDLFSCYDSLNNFEQALYKIQ